MWETGTNSKHNTYKSYAVLLKKKILFIHLFEKESMSKRRGRGREGGRSRLPTECGA